MNRQNKHIPDGMSSVAPFLLFHRELMHQFVSRHCGWGSPVAMVIGLTGPGPPRAEVSGGMPSSPQQASLDNAKWTQRESGTPGDALMHCRSIQRHSHGSTEKHRKAAEITIKQRRSRKYRHCVRYCRKTMAATPFPSCRLKYLPWTLQS